MDWLRFTALLALLAVCIATICGYFVTKTRGFGAFNTSLLVIVLGLSIASLLGAAGILDQHILGNIVIAGIGFAGGLFSRDAKMDGASERNTQDNTPSAAPAHGLRIPLTMTRRVARACHWVALLCEAIGSAFIFLEARRVIAQLAAAGHVDYGGGPPVAYQGWLYDSGSLGFALLLAGILLSGLSLLIEARRD